MPLNRRQFLSSAALAGGGLLLARPGSALAAPLDPDLSATSRVSRLFPSVRLVHGDLHNHTVRSDGAGDARLAFGSMRSAGLDFAALTDHSTISKGTGPAVPLGTCQGPSCGLAGMTEASWAEAGALADAANVDDSFTAIRGFEWSSPQLGHMNVWFGRTWIDPLTTGGVDTTAGTAQFVHDGGAPLTNEQAAQIDAAFRASPTTAVGIRGFQRWLNAAPETPGIGGGLDSLVGFNHPGREPGRFGRFALDEALRPRLVSLEVFNRGEDYLFEGTDSGVVSPIQECLTAGWRPGLIGVTDEHGTAWGTPENNGRTGLYVTSLTRDGVRTAMQSRHMFASRLRGLRIDAAADGVQMGSTVAHTSGPMTFHLDVDRGPAWYGRRLLVQVLQSARAGELLPRVVRALVVTVPAPAEPLISFDVPIDVSDGGWVILRISDPASVDPGGNGNKSISEDARARGTAFEGLGPAIAYTSPFYLTAAAPPAVVPEAPAAVLLPAAAALGLGAAYVYGKRAHTDHSHGDHLHEHAHP